MADVSGRMLALLATLRTGRAFSAAELTARLGVSPRTLRRDVARLRRAGYPVVTRTGPGGGYRLDVGTRMAPLTLDDDEAVAVMLALAALGAAEPAEAGSVHAAATRAYGKVDQLLPSRLRPQVEAVRASLEPAARTVPPVAARVLAELARHTSRNEVVTFRYTSAGGAESLRRCEPHRLVHLDQRWYLYAWDSARGDWRIFRADRIEELTGTGAPFSPRPLPAGGVVRHLLDGMGRDRRTASLTIAAPADRVADAFRHEYAEIEPLGEDSTRVRLRSDSWHRVVQSLALVDADVVVHEPPKLREHCRRFASRLARA